MSSKTTVKTFFNSIYEQESDAIFRFCLVRVSDREQALDLVQETFVRFWQSLSDGKEMSNARSFLFTIAHHLIIDWYRKKKSVSLDGLTSDETAEPYEPAIEENPYSAPELAAEGRYLILAIGRLNRSYRQAVYLRFVEGLSPAEIGEILGISANASSVRVNRGIEELRRLTGYSKEGLSDKYIKEYKRCKNKRACAS